MVANLLRQRAQAVALGDVSLVREIDAALLRAGYRFEQPTKAARAGNPTRKAKAVNTQRETTRG